VAGSTAPAGLHLSRVDYDYEHQEK